MKRLISVALALVFALAVFGAFAEEEPLHDVVYAKVTSSNGGSVNLYQLPGEYRPVVATIANGTALFVEFEGSAWHKVRTTSGVYTGWIKAGEITITTRGLSALNYGCTITGTRSVYSSDGYAALRWGPGLEYDIIENLPTGTVCWLYERCGDWSRVLLSNGHIGYVYSTLLRNTSSSSAFPNVYGYVQVTGNSAIYRQSASYSSKALGTLSSGEIVEILGENSGFWYFYSPTKNIYAYISKDILSPAGLNRVETLCTMYYDNPAVYATDALWNLNAGQVLKVLATDAYVSRVQYEGVIGYVLNDSLVIK